MSVCRRSTVSLSPVACLLLGILCPIPSASAATPPTAVRSFVQEHCASCHAGQSAEAGLDLEALGFDLDNETTRNRWVRIHDRVLDGEMPPKDSETPPPLATRQFLQQTAAQLRAAISKQDAEIGRVLARRLTRREVERSLQDLLGIDVPLADRLPEESQSAAFSTVADSQSMSHFQLERHLSVVDLALEEAFRRALTPPDRYQRDFDARGVARRNPKRRCREPEMLDGQAVVWNSGLIFYGRLPATTAPEDGWYRFTVKVSGLKPPASGGVWSTVRSGLCVSSAPLLNSITVFEARTEPQVLEFEAWLPKRQMLEIRPGDNTLKRARFAGGQVGAGEGGPQDVPGIAIDHLTMERIHRGATDEDVRQHLFGDVSIQKEGQRFRLSSERPRRDVERLMTAFARRAFRRPTDRKTLMPYIERAQAALGEGKGIAEALRVGYRSLLCSPRFLYFTERPGQLDSHAVATRMSYLLTGSTPDEQLLQLADNNSLSRPEVLRQETERLLAGPAGRRFVEDFAAEWLDLDQIDATTPDRKLFRDYDPIVQTSMIEETHAFLETMLRENLSVEKLIDSEFTYLNSRLARFYGIDGVAGDRLQRVRLEPDGRRGGVLTHGAILKVTANGTTTSPVIRGVWISERLLGVPIPAPPTNVPAIEPDIRGARSIREQLAKHRSDASCSSCHLKIDAPGFALENFDPAGKWRDRYAVANGRGRGPAVDASYELADGRSFEDIDGFRQLVLSNPHRLAANVAEKLIVYGTGAPISFADREVVERIADQAAQDNYGFRSILHAVMSSRVFLQK